MRFSEAPYLAFDTETTGLHYPVDRAFGFSIAVPTGETIYMDIRHHPHAIDYFNDEMSRFTGTIICHNASFDYKMADESGLYMPLEQLDDTAIRACLINEHEQSFSLDALAEKYLSERKDQEIYPELAKLFGGRATRNVQMKNMHRAPPELVDPYARKDALLTIRLWEWQRDEIARQGIQDIVTFERRVMAPLIRAEMRGIRVDSKRAEQAMAALTLELEAQQAELNGIVGSEINVDSPKQVKEVFNPKQDEYGEWICDNGRLLPMTETGNPSFSADALRDMEGDRRAELILSIRSTTKTRDTFIGGHVLGHMVGDRVYPTINQNKNAEAGTGTGRLSYTEPAMQQIPSRNKKVAAIVKPIFLPDEGRVWVDADMHSFEVRVFAHLVNNPIILQKYAENSMADFHQMVADLTSLPRNATYSGQPNAKQLNLSMIFNSGNGHTAMQMGMPWEWSSFTGRDGKIVRYQKAGPDALEVIEEYHTKLPGVRLLAERAKQAAETHGYVQTKYGRRLRFPHKFKTYKASGLAIQATAADINKHVILLIEEALGRHGHLILNTHDSYSMSMPEVWEPHWYEVKELVEKSFPWFRVPLVMELSGAGANWWEAVK